MQHQIVVWGQNDSDQITSAPTESTGFSRILPGGSSQTIAIRTDGSVELWGQGSIPPLNGPAFEKFNETMIDGAIGATHFVGIRANNSLFSWGNFMSGQSAAPPPALLATAVAVGSDHGCAIDSNEELQPWGDSLMRLPPAGKFTKIRARSNYTIAICDNGRLYGWGGVFETNEVLTWAGWKRDPKGYAYAVGPFKDLAGSPQATNPKPHILALDANDTIKAWGLDDAGQVTRHPAGKFKAVGAGLSYSIGLDENDRLQHWGKNWGDQIVRPGPRFDVGPAVLDGLANVPVGQFGSISAGSHHATALRLLFAPSVGTHAVNPVPPTGH